MPANYVLIEIYTPVSPVATIDIIVVHGMNPMGNENHEEDVWTDKETRTNWVRELLPKATPNARVLAYHYNANIVFGPSIPGVAGQARNLLECLNIKRQLHPLRPIMWISHSLGGIIVKEALSIAAMEYQAYPMISAFTDTIFFIAVPHNGSRYASCGTFAGQIADVFTFKQDNSYLASVSPDSVYSKELNARFQQLLPRYRFYTWIEGREVPFIGLIVSEDSAKLGSKTVFFYELILYVYFGTYASKITQQKQAPHEVCRYAERNHRNICQFSSDNDPVWRELSADISKAASDATSSFNYSPTLDRWEDLLEVKHHSPPYTGDVAEANAEAESIVEIMNMSQNNRELVEKDMQAGHASEAALSLAKLTLVVLSPLFYLLASSPPIAALGSLLLSTVLVGLPSKDSLLRKAREGQKAEETIMEVEDWAINLLNKQQHATLMASCHLKEAIDRIKIQESHGEQALLLAKARLLQQELQTLVICNTQNIHDRQMRRKKAEIIVKRIENAEKEVEGKDKEETYLYLAKVKKDMEAENNTWCPTEECVIL